MNFESQVLEMLGGITSHLSSIDNRLDKVENRLNNIESEISELKEQTKISRAAINYNGDCLEKLLSELKENHIIA